jgi:hypothetical protein
MMTKHDRRTLMISYLSRPGRTCPPSAQIAPHAGRGEVSVTRPASSALASFAALTLALLVSPGTQAQSLADADPRWSLIPTVGWVLADGDRRAANGVTYGLSLSRVIATDWDLALRGAWEKLGAETGGPGRFSNWSIAADGHWYFAGRQGLSNLGGGQPFAIAGLGVLNERIPGATETSWMAHAGFGADWGMGAWGRLQLDARYRLDANSGHINGSGRFGDWIVGLGWRVPLGAPAQASVPNRLMSDPPAPPVSPALIRPATTR